MTDKRIRIDSGDLQTRIAALTRSHSNPGAASYLNLIAEYLHEAELKSTDPNELPVANETLEAIVLLLYSLAEHFEDA